MRSRSSLSALTRTVFQKRSIAAFVWPCRRSQSKNDSPVSFGADGIIAAIARAIDSLSTSERQLARKKDGAVCIGAGSAEEPITEVLPPGSRKLRRSHQRILSSPVEGPL